MAVRWSLVWGRSQQSCFPPSCYNFTKSCGDSTAGNIFDGFPLTVQTYGQAIDQVALVVKDSLGAQSVVVTSTSNSKFVMNIRLGPQHCDVARVELLFRSTSGNFPVTCSYTKGSATGSASFQTLDQVVVYLNRVLA